jgi:nucleotidyltransferase/DNA polymerase involved in DNA repair
LDFKFIFERMEALCQDVFRRFKESDFKSFQTVVITVRFSGFETKNRSHTIAKPANTLKTLTVESTRLLMPFFDARENTRKKLIRLIGVRIEKFK